MVEWIIIGEFERSVMVLEIKGWVVGDGKERRKEGREMGEGR